MTFSSMRFLADFPSGALLTAAIGFWTLSSGVRPVGWRRAVDALGALLGVDSLIFSILLGFQGGYYQLIERMNPVLHAQLTDRFSLCE